MQIRKIIQSVVKDKNTLMMNKWIFPQIWKMDKYFFPILGVVKLLILVL